MQTVSTLAQFASRTPSAGASTTWISRLVMLGATSIVIGIYWDISWHRTIGRDTFWTPAHLAIQLGGLLGGFTSGWLVLRTTFLGSPEEKAAAVGLWGFRGPFGAWVTIWGCLAMLLSAPFDNWWHDAYGLDVKIISPPHSILALGMWSVVGGCLLLVLRQQNAGQRAPAPSNAARVAVAPPPVADLPAHRPAGSWFYIYGAGILLAMASVFLTEVSFPNEQHTARFFIWSAATYPLYLLGLARASKFRWGSVYIALVYALIVAGMAWVLPLFSGHPKLGPIYNRVDHFVPLPFPLLLFVPAVAIDLIRRLVGQGRSWQRDVGIVLLCSLAFVPLFAATQWYFAKFLLSPGGQNWFFAADRHWGYTERLGEWRTRFWDERNSGDHAPVVPLTFLKMWVGALIASSIGLTLGNWMAKVRR